MKAYHVAALVAFACSCAPCSALVLSPLTPTNMRSAASSAVAPSSVRLAAPLRMQVEAPVKIPDTFNPDLAPAKPSSDKANEKGKKYKLLLFNDNVNRREYVARVLVQTIPELQQADAYLVMQKAHKQGMAVVGVWVFEMAEAYCSSLKAGGLICSVTEESD